jgi:hypothetical protein
MLSFTNIDSFSLVYNRFITCIDRFFPRSYAFNSLSLVLNRLFTCDTLSRF